VDLPFWSSSAASASRARTKSLGGTEASGSPLGGKSRCVKLQRHGDVSSYRFLGSHLPMDALLGKRIHVTLHFAGNQEGAIGVKVLEASAAVLRKSCID